MAMANQECTVLCDTYGSYTSSPPSPPVPPFPCALDALCTADNRRCDRHKRVLFVKDHATGEIFDIPYGNWENWTWYKERISECTGIPVAEIRTIYAGADRDGTQRHSGLQYQSTINMVLRKPVASNDNLTEGPRQDHPTVSERRQRKKKFSRFLCFK